MSQGSTLQARTIAKLPTPTASGLVQRQCACGKHTSASGECEECKQKHEGALQRAAVNTSPVNAIPPGVSEGSSGQSLDNALRSILEPRFAYDFSRVALQSNGAGDIQFGGTDDKDKNAAPAATKTPSASQTKKSTTPDGFDLGPTDPKKAFCLKANSFDVKTSVHNNTHSVATGAQVIKFEGLDTGKSSGKTCDCGCGTYRHWISGFVQVIGPIALAKAKADLVQKSKQASPSPQAIMEYAIAHTPKIVDFSSCQHPLKLDETKFTEEYTACIGDNDPASCKWRYGDGPGATGGLRDGLYVNLRQPFKYEIWDSCQGKSIATKQATLTVQGDKPPRSITWS
jgi:hypothetical protein